ncbi:hypothetical protein ACGFZP_17540 [Kitasatospora sp. NPDC048239]|uniref:hypothetical protein n=1 Tax=Kitasatospora sp. NPDC048239 TaxID=3364046 RepID=UPI003720978D
MQSTPAAVRRGEPVEFPLRLAAVAHRSFPPGTSRIDDPFSLRHFADLTAGYGVPHRPELAEGGGNTFTTMATALLRDLAPPGLPIELALVAHATPDLDCRLAAVTALSELLPGHPLAFAVADCGSAAPFAALRLAGAYARRDGHRAVAVFALDQHTLPYGSGPRPAADAGVALLFTDTGTEGRLTLSRLPGTTAEEVPDALRSALTGLGAGPDLPLVLGPGLDRARHLPGHTGRIAQSAPGRPASGTLTALAAEPGRARHLALVDYDPADRDLSVCLIERGS